MFSIFIKDQKFWKIIKRIKHVMKICNFLFLIYQLFSLLSFLKKHFYSCLMEITEMYLCKNRQNILVCPVPGVCESITLQYQLLYNQVLLSLNLFKTKYSIRSFVQRRPIRKKCFLSYISHSWHSWRHHLVTFNFGLSEQLVHRCRRARKNV